MTDENQLEEGELHENDDVEEAHDPKNAPAQEVAAADKAEDAAPKAKKRKGDKSGKDPMQKVAAPAGQDSKIDDKGAMPFKEGYKTKAGMINAAYQKMNGMKKEELAVLMSKIMQESSTEDGEVVVENQVDDVNYQTDWNDDLNALVNSEATLSEEFKSKAETIFNMAIKNKLSEEVDRLEEKYNEELTAEIEETKTGLVDKVDSYLNYVVENWMEENKLAVQSGLRTEIAEKFMNNLKDLFTESYIDVPESKVDLVDDLAAEVEELETSLNDQTAKSIAMQEELEGYKRDSIIREASKDLAETQIEKLKALTEKADFEDEESFTKKVATVKESYFNKKATPTSALTEETDEDTNEVETSGSMSQYVNALKTQIKT